MSYCTHCNDCYLSQEVALDLNNQTLDKHALQYAEKLLKCPGCQCPLHKHKPSTPNETGSMKRKEYEELDVENEKKQKVQDSDSDHDDHGGYDQIYHCAEEPTLADSHRIFLLEQYRLLCEKTGNRHPFYHKLFETDYSRNLWFNSGLDFGQQEVLEPDNNILYWIERMFEYESCDEESWDSMLQYVIDQHEKIGNKSIIAMAKERFPQLYN